MHKVATNFVKIRDKMEASTVVSEALAIQRIINTELAKTGDMEDKLERILKAFTTVTNSRETLLYATVDENYLEYMGGYHAQNYKNNIRFDEDDIGKCASAKRPIVQIMEKEYCSRLSVPILRLNSTAGVIAIIQVGTKGFTEQQIELAETLALVLQDLLSAKEFTDYRNQIIREKGFVVRNVLHGSRMNKGYGVGRAVIHHRHRDLQNIFAENTELEKSKLAEGQRRMVEYIDNKISESGNYLGNTAEIMEAYKMFALDKGWYKKITADIEKGYTAEAAIEHVYEDIWNKLSATNDPYLREKLYDLRDISDRLRSFINGGDIDTQIAPDEDIIIIAQTMGPAELMDYNYERIRGLIIEDCTPTMHVVIVARALNIPVIAKIHGVMKDVKAGELIAINGNDAAVYIDPSESVISEYRKKSVGLKKVFADLKDIADKPSKTIDDIKINLFLNYGLDLDYNYIEPTRCAGIGLYRTEITFMTSDKLPDVESQIRQYQKLYSLLDDKKNYFPQFRCRFG